MSSGSSSDDGPESLMTKRALEISLSPPRAPPHGTAHRALLLGKAPDDRTASLFGIRPKSTKDRTRGDGRREETGRTTNTTDDMSQEAHSRISHDTLQRRILDRLRRSHDAGTMSSSSIVNPSNRRYGRLPHPHLPSGPEVPDQITRWLGVLLPLEWQNRWRDSGRARAVFDFAVPATVPVVAASHPRAVPTFLALTSSKRMKRVRYGAHERQIVDVLIPTEPKEEATAAKNGATSTTSTTAATATTTSTTGSPFTGNGRLIVFVHGGAWGSGYPWMYRLIAKPLLDQGWTVAIPGYRTYPDGRVREQVSDCDNAVRALAEEYPSFFERSDGDRPTSKPRVTLMGHSSGAHIAFMLLVQRLEGILQHRSSASRVSNGTVSSGEGSPISDTREINGGTCGFDTFMGLSGPYDISHHYDYEAARGVEEFSPMKPVCGYTRERFRHNSPALRLQSLLGKYDTGEGGFLSSILPAFFFLHGIEDTTVPFTATAEAARIVRSCGVPDCHEIYVSDTGHQDVVMHLMLGGRSRNVIVETLRSFPNPPTTKTKVDAKLLATSKL